MHLCPSFHRTTVPQQPCCQGDFALIHPLFTLAHSWAVLLSGVCCSLPFCRRWQIHYGGYLLAACQSQQLSQAVQPIPLASPTLQIRVCDVRAGSSQHRTQSRMCVHPRVATRTQPSHRRGLLGTAGVLSAAAAVPSPGASGATAEGSGAASTDGTAAAGTDAAAAASGSTAAVDAGSAAAVAKPASLAPVKIATDSSAPGVGPPSGAAAAPSGGETALKPSALEAAATTGAVAGLPPVTPRLASAVAA